MNRCYCGAKSVEDKSVDFSKYDIGIEVKFCSQDCLEDFLYDYGYFVISQSNDLETFDYKIYEKEIDGVKKLKVEIMFFDYLRYEACRDTNYTVLDGWLWDEEEMDKEIVKQLIDRKKIND